MTLKIEGTGFEDGAIIRPGQIKDCNGCVGMVGVGGILCSQGNNIEWVAPPFLGCDLLTAKGDVLVATAAATGVALPVGTDGQVLTACSTCASGLTWAAGGGGGGSTLCGATCTSPSFSTYLGYCAGDYASACACFNTVIGSCAALSLGDAECTTVIGMGALKCAIGSTNCCTVTSVSLVSGGTALPAPMTAAGYSSGTVVSCTSILARADTSTCYMVLCTCTGSGSGGEARVRFDSTGTPLSTVGGGGSSFGGNGYQVGDLVYFPGTSVGGTTPADDIVISVSALGNAVYCFVPQCGTDGTGTGYQAKVCRSISTGAVTGARTCCGGEGYAVGDTITLPGTSLGGSSPDQDVSITVGFVTNGLTGTQNVALGYAAGATAVYPCGSIYIGVGADTFSDVATSSYQNVGAIAIGTNAKASTSSTSTGVAIGTNSNARPATVAIGNNAGANQTGINNTFIGDGSGCAGGTGNNNTFVGPYTAQSVLTAECNVGIGISSLAGLTSGNGNTVMGSYAGGVINTGTGNIVIGTIAGCSLTTGNLNTIIGCWAGGSLTTGCENVLIGARTGGLSAACQNTLVGTCAGRTVNSTAIQNTFMGANAGCFVQTGALNTILGYAAGCTLTNGSNNVIIGANQQVPVITGSCQLMIGWGTGCWLTGCSTGAIRPAAGIMDCAASTGTVGQYMWTTGANAVIWASSSPSDVRDKEVLGPLPTALPVINQIEPITYRWKERDSDVAQEEIIYGFSAQQLQEIDSVLVDSSDLDHLRIHDRKIVPLLVNAIKELSAKNGELEARIRSLEITI